MWRNYITHSVVISSNCQGFKLLHANPFSDSQYISMEVSLSFLIHVATLQSPILPSSFHRKDYGMFQLSFSQDFNCHFFDLITPLVFNSFHSRDSSTKTYWQLAHWFWPQSFAHRVPHRSLLAKSFQLQPCVFVFVPYHRW